MNFQDVKNFMKGDADSTAAGTLKAMSLDDLRNYFQSENLTFEELQKQAARTKERQLMEEIEDYKREKN